jgi:hypothetical protein
VSILCGGAVRRISRRFGGDLRIWWGEASGRAKPMFSAMLPTR